MAACGFRKKEPQMNADERRCSPVMGFSESSSYAPLPATNFGAIHNKGKRQKFLLSPRSVFMKSCLSEFRTRMTRIFTDPRASASYAQSAFHQVCSSLKNPASEMKVSAFICVHLRFFNGVIFQTGLTGSTGYVFNPVHPVILSNLKCQTPAPWLSAIVREVS